MRRFFLGKCRVTDVSVSSRCWSARQTLPQIEVADVVEVIKTVEMIVAVRLFPQEKGCGDFGLGYPWWRS